jgi:cellulose synthase/poly-beta-1,6-N-acetylglucosamine synthase-like glycosyltransferase
MRVKNWVRPRGLAALGLPCQLMGSGMAFPWDTIRAAKIAGGSTVDDLELGLELTLTKHPPLFCPSASVSSPFPVSVKGAKIQRKRWEQGHVGVILRRFPRLIWNSLAQKNLGLFALSLDLSVPPLSLLCIFVLSMLFASVAAACLGVHSAALIICAINLLVFSFAVALAWWKFGRDVVSPGAVMSIPHYILSKLGIYRDILFDRKPAEWINSDRIKS